MPKFTIITTVFNAESYILGCLLSVKSQTYKDYEHIIIDAKSTDNTLHIINAAMDEHMIVLSEPDQGIYYGYNKGISLASGEIVIFLNADDKFLTNLRYNN